MLAGPLWRSRTASSIRIRLDRFFCDLLFFRISHVQYFLAMHLHCLLLVVFVRRKQWKRFTSGR